MRNFILELRRKKLILLLVTGFIIAVLLSAAFILPTKEPASPETFNPRMSANEVRTTDVYYLLGPFAVSEEDNVVRENLYIAITEDELIVISTGRINDTGIPIYGEDISEEDIDDLSPVKVKGSSEYMGDDINALLADFYNELIGENVADTYNVDKVFGSYYLDTDYSGTNNTLIMWIFWPLVVGIIVITLIIVELRNSKKLINDLKVYEESGKLAEYEEDFLSAKGDYNKKLKVLLTKKYLYSLKTNFLIIPLDDIINVYGSCMINNEINKQEFIAIETKSGSRYFILPKLRESNHQGIDAFRDQLKEIAKENSYDYRI